MLSLDAFLTRAWDRYSTLCPDAHPIHALLGERGETVINDHVAFRTFNLPGMTRMDLGRVFEAWGYRMKDDTLEFTEKKLLANYWIHPDESFPKVFVSELLVEKCSPELQDWIRGFAKLAGPLCAESCLEPSWAPVRHADCERFYAESEYAAWTAAFGIQVNHFTVLVNRLRSFASLEALDELLLQRGFRLNVAGGLIKGKPAASYNVGIPIDAIVSHLETTNPDTLARVRPAILE